MKETNQNPETDDTLSNLPYANCLNCGAELKGKYCHVCGQEATSQTPSVLAFIVEYLNHAFIWDSNFVPTLWNLIRRPGYLTNEFLKGKFVSHEHPLKLNMFLLFVFVTLFALFATQEKLNDSAEALTHHELEFPDIQMTLLKSDTGYIKKIYESPRDTILLSAPLYLTEKFPEIISNIETKEDSKGEGLDKWVAAIPKVLIDDEIIVMDDNNYYKFNEDNDANLEINLNMILSVWSKTLQIISQYFPIILLLTAPFLSISLSLVQRKSKRPHIYHFIFSLHYTALVEFIIICIYILYLTCAPPMSILEYILIIGSCVYLTIAFRNVYEIKNWGTAIIKSLLTSCIYFFILLSIFIIIFFTACFIVVINKLWI